MKLGPILLAAIASMLVVSTEANAAATLQTNGAGQLTGATGVQIGGVLYDVTFQEGFCADVFGVCDAAHFDFTTEASAEAAAAALFSQVLIDGPAGAFDSNPGLIFGCIGADYCGVLIPFATDAGTLFGSIALNGAPGSVFGFDPIGTTDGPFNSADTSRDLRSVWANFTIAPVSAVPESSTWAMMLLGFGLLGCALRRQARSGRTFETAQD